LGVEGKPYPTTPGRRQPVAMGLASVEGGEADGEGDELEFNPNEELQLIALAIRLPSLN